MCGIVAAVAGRNVVPVLLEGLRKLEYRGYDSAGLALIGEAGLQRLRAVGRVAELTAQAEETRIAGQTGISHTRWATHGVPSERNAHPHISGGLAVVHNGIIENHEALRAFLKSEGYVFTSDTDTEVVAHLVDFELRNTPDFFTAVRAAIARLQGAYALAILREADPDRIIVAREGSPLLRYRTRDITFLMREPCSCGRTTVRIHRLLGRTDDMMIVRGVNIFPSQIENVLMRIEGTQPHYQIVIDRGATHLDEIEVQVEVEESVFSDLTSAMEKLRKRIHDELKSELGISAHIKLVEPRSIARSEGKAKRIIDKRSI